MKYSIKVSEVKNGSENLRGLATVVLGDSFKLNNIAILNNSEKNQLYVAMPSYKTNQVDEQGKAVYKDIYNPTTAKFRSELYDNILNAFDELQNHQAKNSYKVEINSKDTTMPEFTVRVTPYEKEGTNIKGLASIHLADCLAVNNVTLREGKEGDLFVAMPSYKAKQVDEQGNAVYKDICNPVTQKFREKLYDAIASSYMDAKRESVIGKLNDNKDTVNRNQTDAPSREHNQPSRDEAR